MYRRKIWLLLLVAIGFLFLAALPDMIVHASPASPQPFTLTQPDGTTFTAVQWGDEFLNGFETVDGYAIARQESSGYWYYLTTDLTGNLVPAQKDAATLFVGIDSPAGLKKNIRPPEFLSIDLIDSISGQKFAPDSPSATGTQKVLVLLAGFPNAEGRTPATYWQNLIFGGSNSLKHYYETVSYGAFSIAPAAETYGTANDGVIGWLNLSAYYSGHPNPGAVVSDVNRYITKRALEAAVDYIDYAGFDLDSSGTISTDELHIIVIVAGFDRSYAYGATTNEPAVWAHNADLKRVGAPTLDGVVLGNADRGGYYSQVGEYHAAFDPYMEHEATMGVIAHEFGHDLKWPDLYDTDNSSFGVGVWSLMGYGAWNGVTYPGDSPAFPSAWEKWYQGWMTPTTISGYSYGQSIAQAETNPSAYLLRPNPQAVDWTYRESSGEGEYFLVENRQLTSYDTALPGCGLLIWHIDESVYYDYYANANENRPLVKLMQADGLDELRYAVDRGDAGDPFPGSTGKRSFTLYSVPNSKLYDGTESYVRVTNISNCGASMTADLLYGYPVPTVNSLTPGYSGPSTSSFTLTLKGLDFYSSSVVRWNGSDRTTKYINGNKLEATITAADMIALGGVGNSASVTVFNPQPGGGESAPRMYMIIDLSTIVPRIFLPAIYKDYDSGPWPGYIILMNEWFEGTVPGYKWEISENGSGDYKWTKRGCRPFNGLFSGWVAGGGADGGLLPCGSLYPDNMDTAMTFGPFSTEQGILNGELVFKMFINTEPGRDFLRVTAGVGGVSEWGVAYSGNSGGWISGTLNLNDVDGLGTSVIGYPKVWVRFRFTSDYLGHTGEGAYIDDIVLRVCKTTECNIDSSGGFSPAPDSLISTDDMLVEPFQYSPTE